RDWPSDVCSSDLPGATPSTRPPCWPSWAWAPRAARRSCSPPTPTARTPHWTGSRSWSPRASRNCPKRSDTRIRFTVNVARRRAPHRHKGPPGSPGGPFAFPFPGRKRNPPELRASLYTAPVLIPYARRVDGMFRGPHTLRGTGAGGGTQPVRRVRPLQVLGRGRPGPLPVAAGHGVHDQAVLRPGPGRVGRFRHGVHPGDLVAQPGQGRGQGVAGRGLDQRLVEPAVEGAQVVAAPLAGPLLAQADEAAQHLEVGVGAALGRAGGTEGFEQQ